MADKKSELFQPKWSEYHKFWLKISWPWRPAPSQIKFWEEKIKQIKKKKPTACFLTLGVTPEIRDILAKYKIKVTMLDANKTMFKAMAGFLKRKRNPKEKLVIGDWLEMANIFPCNSFDYIISDAPHSNIPWSQYDRFFSGINKILKKSGRLLLGSFGFDIKFNLTPSQMVDKYLDDKKHFENFQNRVNIFYRYRKAYNKKAHCYEFKKIVQALTKEIKKRNLSLDILGNILPTKDFSLLTDYVEVGAPLKVFLKKISKFFTPKKIVLDKSHPSMQLRSDLILKPKK